METRFSDGRTEMQSFDDPEALARAMREQLAREDVLSVTGHKVGSTRNDGKREYVLNALGQWERVGKKRRQA